MARPHDVDAQHVKQRTQDFVRLRRAARILRSSVAQSERRVEVAQQKLLARALDNRLNAMALDALKPFGSRIPYRALSSAGYRTVGQLVGVSQSSLAQVHGIGPTSAAETARATTALRSRTWDEVSQSLSSLLAADEASELMHEIAILKYRREVNDRFGNQVPTLVDLATQGRNSALVVRSRARRSRTRERASTAFALASSAYEEMLNAGVITHLEAAAEPARYEEPPAPSSREAMNQLAGDYSVATPENLLSRTEEWSHARADGTIRRLGDPRRAWAAAGVAASLVAVTAMGAVASPNSAPPISNELSVALPTAVATPTPEPTPSDAQLDPQAVAETNLANELDLQSTWETNYERSTESEARASNSQVLFEGSHFVSGVVDGDTVLLDGVTTVRIIGIDAPEFNQCGFEQALAFARDTLDQQRVDVEVVEGGPTTDHYGRSLAYIVLESGEDYGLSIISAGLAAARYDGYDGYSPHPRQEAYHEADDKTEHACGDENPPRTEAVLAAALLAQQEEERLAAEEAEREAAAERAREEEERRRRDAEPWNYPGPDLDCKDIGKKVRITGPDYHRLDADNDGWGCESYG